MTWTQTTNAAKAQQALEIKVYLLNNSCWTIPVQSKTTCKDVVVWACDSVRVQDPTWVSRFFAIYESVDGFTLGSEVPMEESAVVAFNRCSKIYFAQRLFTRASVSSLDPNLILIRYAQAVHSVMSGELPCPLDALIQLSALRLQVTFGNNATIHKTGYLSSRLLEIIPTAEIPKQPPMVWERQLLSEHFQYDGSNPMLDYMKIVSQLDSYGLQVFELRTTDQVQQMGVRPIDSKVTIGVGARGLVFLKPPELIEMTSFPLAQLIGWGFTPSETFWFEASASTAEDASRFEYETTEGHRISQLLTDYVAEKMLEDGETIRVKLVSSAGESKWTTSETDRRNSKSNSRQLTTAATRIQALFRGYLFRRNLEYLYGTVRIQSFWRGHMARCKFHEQLQEQSEKSMEYDSGGRGEHVAASTTIQSNYRGYCVRRDLLRMDEELSATQIQATFRGHQARQTLGGI